MAQVEQGLISTGNAVGYNTDQLKKMASALQENTLFGDENILQNVTAQLLTFTNITGREFERTQQAALDLATRLDGDLKSASIQLGKALNDPILGLSALAESGIQFSNDQKVLINSLVEGGKIAEAQGLILDELAKQYGGSAAAAAKAGLGPFTQLKNILGDITEEFGEIILEGLNPIIESVKELALGFSSLSPETKKFLVVFGGIAAAVGPLLALAGTILPAIGTGLALLTGPIGLIVAGLTAVGVVIYKNWEPIKATLVDIANYFIDLYNESTLFKTVVEAISTNFKNILAVGKFVFSTLGTIISAVAENIQAGFKPLGGLIKAVLTGDIASIPAILAAGFTNGFAVAKDAVADIKKDFETLKGVVAGNITEGIKNVTENRQYKFLSKNFDATAVEENVANAVVKGLAQGAAAAGGGAGTPQGQRLNIDVAPIRLFDFDANAIEAPILNNRVLEAMDENIIAFQDRLLDFKAETAEILSATAANFLTGFGDILGGIVAGTAGLDDVAGLLLRTMGDLAQQLGQSAIKIGVTMKALKLSFKSPLAAIAAGVGLVAFGALLKAAASNFAGNFSGGGIVPGTSFSGDRLIAGVNSGELILSVAQQKNLVGALANRQPVILQPSIEYGYRGFKVRLDEVDNFNKRVG